MPVGRPSKPTALKVLEGNPGQRRLPQNEPTPEPGLPDPPDILNDIARKEWVERGAILANMSVLSQADLAIFAAYCQAWGDYIEAREGINLLRAQYPKEEAYRALVLECPSGAIKKNPLLDAANHAARDMVRYAGDLGMTPAARARLAVLPPDKRQESKLKTLMYAEKKKAGTNGRSK